MPELENVIQLSWNTLKIENDQRSWPDKHTLYFLSPYFVYPVQVDDLAQAAAACRIENVMIRVGYYFSVNGLNQAKMSQKEIQLPWLLFCKRSFQEIRERI